MEQQQISLPEATANRLQVLSKFSGVSYEDLVKELYLEYNKVSIQTDTSLRTPEEKLDYCSKVMNTRYTNRIPFKPYNVITVGIGRVFNTNSGGRRGEMYIVVDDNGKSVLRSVGLTGKDADIIKNVNTMCMYKDVLLGKYKDGNFSGDDRTVFKNPEKLEINPLSILDELKINRCTIATSIDNCSIEEKSSDGKYYAKKTDWRIMQGMIVSYKKGVKEGQEWGVYTIADDSMKDDVVISVDGSKIAKRSFTVWVNPVWIIYEKDNTIDFVGTISVNPNSKEVSMTASLLIPVHTPYGGIKA
jgi:hypothetical protein